MQTERCEIEWCERPSEYGAQANGITGARGYYHVCLRCLLSHRRFKRSRIATDLATRTKVEVWKIRIADAYVQGYKNADRS